MPVRYLWRRMDTTFRRFRNKHGEVWQIGWYRSPFWTAPEEGGPPFRRVTVVCLSVRTGRRQSLPLGPGAPGPEAFREVVAQAARTWRLRPERIQVGDPRIAEDLSALLSGEKVAVEARDDLPDLRVLLEGEAAFARDTAPPTALSAPGLTVERMAAFARAAARFGEAAPWRHLGRGDMLLLESAGLPEELQWAWVLGPPHSEGGILFRPELEESSGEDSGSEYPSTEEESDWEDDWGDEPVDLEEADEWDMEPWEDELPATPGCWRITLVPPSELPPEDIELWMEHDLALAGSTAYPLALRTGPEGDERPDARLLAWFEAILAALAATTEEEMDTGRWEKEVATADGPVRLVLSLPDVLEPPFTDIFPLDADDDRPEAERRAEDLADEANESWGRRQIHLARRAVALWPDCFDGWLVLAHRALDLESARDLYAEAVAAAERLMPGIGKGEAGPRDEDEEPWLFPWIWARIGLAKSLWSLGSREEAVGHFQRILAVDPSDHERVRYLLVHALLALGWNDEAGDLLAWYAEDGADWLYTRALLTFRQEGDSPSARRQMAAALQADRPVARQLLGLAPPEEDEAESHTVLFQDVWADTPGALEALRAQSAASAAEAKARKAKKKVEKKKRKRR